MGVWTAAWAIAVKDWRRFVRQPFFMAVSVLVPLVFVLFYSLIVPSSQTNPIVVAMDDRSPAASQFLETLRTMRSEEAPWFEIVTDDAERARTMLGSGEAIGMVVIPSGFGEAVAGDRGTVEMHIHNINSDYSKNLALRLDHAVRRFAALNERPVIAVNETTRFPRTLSMGSYISTSILLFAAVYAGISGAGDRFDDSSRAVLCRRPEGIGVTGAQTGCFEPDDESGVGEPDVDADRSRRIAVVGEERPRLPRVAAFDCDCCDALPDHRTVHLVKRGHGRGPPSASHVG